MSDETLDLTVFEGHPQSLVITLLGSYVHPEERTVWSGGLVRLLGELGFSVGAARVALARLTRRDLLARVRDGRLVHYRLTARASSLLDEGDRRIFSLGRNLRPPEVWTVLWNGIPEDRRVQRVRLARRLRFLGFGSLQDGTWISPHDRDEEIRPLLDDLGVASHVAVLVGRPAGSVDFEPVVARAWEFDELAIRYGAFVAAFGLYGDTRRELDEREAFLVRTRLVHAFRDFALLDPGLPEDVVATDGYRARAVSLFDELYASLAAPAQRHFDETTAPPRRGDARARGRGRGPRLASVR
ncbi:MAG: PaaX family transcriptional regulator [Actinomycetota bacterium]|nr:PaaX family transcriptional regulator [Actinomycetota bacterium]